MRFRFLLILCIALFTSLLPAECRGEALLRAAFPYSLTKEAGVAHAGSTQLLYISVQNFGNEEEAAEITAALPEEFTALAGDGWEVDGQEVRIHWTLPADYGEQFLAVPVKCSEEAGEGVYGIPVFLRTKEGVKEERISFSAGPAEEEQDQKAAQTWYIQSVLLPVNEDGERDARQEKDTLVTPDVTLENMKNRLTGGRGVDWDALTAKPNTYLLLDMRNPKKDVRTIHLSAELIDKGTGEVRPGLIAAAGEGESLDRTKMRSEAALSLNGHKMQTAVVPLYVDPFSIAEGDYALRLTLFDGETERVTELPLTVVKKRSVGFATLGFALLSLLALAASIGGLKRCILSIGAKGDITVSLFAAMAFGGVVVPVTLLGDFLHVLLGPFSGLVTGLLSGVVQYLLLVSLLVLFRRPGVCALFFLMRWMLSAVLFGRVTPVGILICAVSIVILETTLYLAGFYRKKELTPLYAMGISFLIGLCDAGITFVNMEQLMFFYRLYYADWFIGLYMLMNGLLYSTLGSWMGYRIGSRLKQVMGT